MAKIRVGMIVFLFSLMGSLAMGSVYWDFEPGDTGSCMGWKNFSGSSAAVVSSSFADGENYQIRDIGTNNWAALYKDNLSISIAASTDYIQLDACLQWASAQFDYFDLFIYTQRAGSDPYTVRLAPGGSTFITLNNARYKLFDLTPTGNAPVMQVGDVITQVKVNVYFAGQGSLNLDNVYVVTGTSHAQFRKFTGVNHGGPDGLMTQALSWDRSGVNWENLEPTQGNYDLNYLAYWQNFVTAHQNINANVLPVLCYNGNYAWKGTQSWEAVDDINDPNTKHIYTYLSGDQFTRDTYVWNGSNWFFSSTTTVTGDASFPVTANQVSAWEAYVTEAVTNLRQSPYNVEYFQIWNEACPNGITWKGNMDMFFERIHFPAADIIRSNGGKVVYNPLGAYCWPIIWADRYNAWDSIDVVALHYVSLSNFAFVYGLMAERNHGDKGLWQTEWGWENSPSSHPDDSVIANMYPRFLDWCLRHGLREDPDKFKMMWFMWNQNPEAGRTQYMTFYVPHPTLYNHGKSMETLGMVLRGDIIDRYLDVTTNTGYTTCDMTDDDPSIEAFSVDNKIVVAVHLKFSDLSTTPSIEINIPGLTNKSILSVKRYDQAGYRTDLLSASGFVGNNYVVTVPTADDVSSPIQSWVNSRWMQTYYIVVTTAEETKQDWTFEDGTSQGWKDSTGSAATVVAGSFPDGGSYQIFQIGTNATALLSIDGLAVTVTGTDNYVGLDTSVQFGAYTQFAAYVLNVYTAEGGSDPYTYQLAPNGSAPVGCDNVLVSLFNLTPTRNAPALSLGDTITKIEVKVFFSGQGALYVDNVSLSTLSSMFSDGFESGNFTAGGWTSSGAAVQTTYKYAGTYAARFRSSNSLTKSLSTANYQNIQVSYARYTRSCTSSCHFIAEWYNGSTWTTLENVTGNSAWAVKTFTLPAGANNKSGFKIRFRTSGNGSSNYGYLDEVQVIGQIIQ
jgi:hypothetical protein